MVGPLDQEPLTKHLRVTEKSTAMDTWSLLENRLQLPINGRCESYILPVGLAITRGSRTDILRLVQASFGSRLIVDAKSTA